MQKRSLTSYLTSSHLTHLTFDLFTWPAQYSTVTQVQSKDYLSAPITYPSLAPISLPAQSQIPRVWNMEDLPEEVLTAIIGLALRGATRVRSGKALDRPTSLLRVNKKFNRIADPIFYNQPLCLYSTQAKQMCGQGEPTYPSKDDVPISEHASRSSASAMSYRSTISNASPLQRWGSGSRSPNWHRYQNIQLHFHPEHSFLRFPHCDGGIFHPQHGLSHEDCHNDAQVISTLMKASGVPGLVRTGAIEIRIEFHDNCPFHDPDSYVDSEGPPRWHVPMWSVLQVAKILGRLRWVLGVDSPISKASRLVTLPQLPWAAQNIKGDFSNIQLDTDFTSILVLSYYGREGHYFEETNSSSREVENRYFNTSSYNVYLGDWVDSFEDQRCSSYSISPQGKVSRRDQVDVDLLMQDHGNCLNRIESSDVLWFLAGAQDRALCVEIRSARHEARARRCHSC